MRVRSGILVLFLCSLLLGVVEAEEKLAVQIDAIHENDHLAGKVTGLTRKGTEQYKVVVYVQTDKWYIHPYERGGAGKSWAAIQEDGSWRIETVRSEFPASRVAALVVRKESRPPATAAHLLSMTHEALVIRELEGTADFGKL